MEQWRAFVDGVSSGPWVASGAAMILRRILGYDVSVRDTLETGAAAIFVAFFVAPGVAEYWQMGPSAAAATGAVLMLVGKPAVHFLIRFAQTARDDPKSIFGRRKND